MMQAKGFNTPRLQVRKVEASDLPTLLPIYQSNPTYVEWEGEQSGHYDLSMIERDWQMATSTPGRHLAAIHRKKEDKAIGIVEWLEEHPLDQFPWLGLLIIHGDEQRKGVGHEVVKGFIHYAKETTSWQSLRIAVFEENQPAQTFWQTLGFVPFETVERQLASGVMKRLIKMERLV
ncbi:Protein N-acetyltransferase, RimJ/RimL family [Marininema mesophilum]|uniref:Protein N-acetyltransferase, RimJ/RimL family n=1 Tax=Marininema mesophilum TaxID=1048340 RepID=A0A1H2ZFH2_9BACL|nr:GNAT family N-acetyltransferase [Marininema mesophilum]SDX16150.1 Protein N-acetyltransferase, RimJ/RimL family [Marininema mesophilum]